MFINRKLAYAKHQHFFFIYEFFANKNKLVHKHEIEFNVNLSQKFSILNYMEIMKKDSSCKTIHIV